MSKYLTAADIQMAIAMTTSTDSGAIIHLLSTLIPKIEAEAKARSEGKRWVNSHPVVRLLTYNAYRLSYPPGSDRTSTALQALDDCQALPNSTQQMEAGKGEFSMAVWQPLG